MKAKKSILKLEQFSIVKSSLQTNSFEDVLPVKFGEYMDNLPIDINFDVLNSPNDEVEGKELYMVSVIININNENNPGYGISVEGAGLFSFPKEDDLKSNMKNDLILSGINICITSVRNYITTLTTFGPFGQYILPTIDMNDLFQQKQKED